MQSCENCLEHMLYGCGGHGDFAVDRKKPCWKSNYPPLEQENTELKQELEVYKKMLEIARSNMFCVFCNLIKNCKQHCDEGCQESLLDEARKELAK
jgi:hypothetical protein